MQSRILVVLSVCIALVSGASLSSNGTSGSELDGKSFTVKQESHQHSHNITSQFVHDFIKNFNKSDAVNATLKGVNSTDVKSNSSTTLKTRDLDAAVKRLNVTDNSTVTVTSPANDSPQVDDVKFRPVVEMKLSNSTALKNSSLDNSTEAVDSAEKQMRRAVSDKKADAKDDLESVSNSTVSKSAFNATQLNSTEANKTARAAGDGKPNVKISLFHLPSFADLTFIKSNASALNDSLSLNSTVASNSTTNSTARTMRQATVVDFLALDEEDDAKAQNGTEVAKNGTEDASKEETLEDTLGDFM